MDADDNSLLLGYNGACMGNQIPTVQGMYYLYFKDLWVLGLIPLLHCEVLGSNHGPETVYREVFLASPT